MKLYLLVLLFLVGCNTAKEVKVNPSDQDVNQSVEISEHEEIKTERKDRVEKTDEEWRALLSKEEYYVIRDKGTERPFTGALLENKETGVYTCRACGLDLFHSNSKFKSGTGWPSYYEPIKKENIKEDTDYHLIYPRTEIMCARCDGHLGHVFSDGPAPTGLRYCVNSLSLSFEKGE